MEVNDQLIDKLAHLARLQFNDEEKAEIKNDLQKMIGFVEKLNELDVSTVEPLLHISGESLSLREDVPGETITREEALKNTAHQDGKFFKVPKVIKYPGN